MWPIWVIQIIISIAISVIAYLIAPKPKKQKPGEVKDMDSPTADGAREIPVVFGTVTVKGLNVLYSGEKGTYSYDIKS